MIDEILDAAKKQISDYTRDMPYWHKELIERSLKEAIELGYKQGVDDAKALVEQAYLKGREDAKYHMTGPLKMKSLYDK